MIPPAKGVKTAKPLKKVALEDEDLEIGMTMIMKIQNFDRVYSVEEGNRVILRLREAILKVKP